VACRTDARLRHGKPGKGERCNNSLKPFRGTQWVFEPTRKSLANSQVKRGSLRHLPDANGAIEAAGEDGGAVRGEGDASSKWLLAC
jgi:hypothetical protein